jgi:branched-chain amino acid transport system permease protein
MRFMMTTLILMEVYAIVAMSLNLVLGIAGRFSAYEAALMGVGAYTAALLATNLGFDLLWGCLAGALLCALIGTAFQIAARHMDFFTFNITSFAFQMVLYETLLKWRGVTGGSFGIFNIPRPEILGVSFTTLEAYVALTTVCAGAIIALLLYIERSPFALALRGMRDGEKALESLGKNTFVLKLKVFAIAGAATGFAGGLLAGLLRTIHPSMFFVYLSVVLMVFVVAGGRGNLRGTVIAVVALIVLEQAITLIPGIPTSQIGALQRVFYGVVLLGVILFRPAGLLPESPIFTRKKFSDIEPVKDGFAFLSERRSGEPRS